MTKPEVLIVFYCTLVSAASLAGGWLPTLVRFTHVRIQLMMSFVAGVMLGVALLHLLPHAVEFAPSVAWATAWLLGGLLVMFFLMRAFDFHHHEDAEADQDPEPCPGHDDGPHHHEHSSAGRVHGQHPISWMGLCVGMVIHSLLDGVALAASVAVEADQAQPGLALVGLGTFLAVFFHKPLDALSITTLMRVGAWSAGSQAAVNIGFALTCPLGALLFWLGVTQLVGEQGVLISSALAFSAGCFLCIALSDLLPEVAFHSHDQLKLSAALLLGVVLAVAIELLHTSAAHTDHSPHHHEHPAGPSHHDEGISTSGRAG